MTPSPTHGTLHDPNRAHRVLDIVYWTNKFPLETHTEWFSSSCVDSPRQLALMEQSKSRTGEGINRTLTDVFVWKSAANDYLSPLTGIGGRPWMDADAAWPCDSDGCPLQFIAQINFVDSTDLIPFELPGDVLLLFARWSDGYINWDLESMHLQWTSSLGSLVDRQRTCPPGSLLPFCCEGVIYRTEQTWEPGGPDEVLRIGVNEMQATLVGTFSEIPQGWPLEEEETLICVFSSFSFWGDWPLCDVEYASLWSQLDGKNPSDLGATYADAGAIWVYRDAHGRIRHQMAC